MNEVLIGMVSAAAAGCAWVAVSCWREEREARRAHDGRPLERRERKALKALEESVRTPCPDDLAFAERCIEEELAVDAEGGDAA